MIGGLPAKWVWVGLACFCWALCAMCLWSEVSWRGAGCSRSHVWRSAGCWSGQLGLFRVVSPAGRLGLIDLANPMHACFPSLCLHRTHQCPFGQSKFHGHAETHCGRKYPDQGKWDGKNSWPFLQSETVIISTMNVGLQGQGSGRWAFCLCRLVTLGEGHMLTIRQPRCH